MEPFKEPFKGTPKPYSNDYRLVFSDKQECECIAPGSDPNRFRMVAQGLSSSGLRIGFRV